MQRGQEVFGMAVVHLVRVCPVARHCRDREQLQLEETIRHSAFCQLTLFIRPITSIDEVNFAHQRLMPLHVLCI